MKKLLVFLLLNVPFYGLFAQGFEAGVVLGANFSQIDGDGLYGYNRIGLVAGGRVDAVLTKRWRLGFEMLFSQLGSDINKYDLPTDFDNIRLNYVEVPVSIIFKEWLVDDEDTEGDEFHRFEVMGGFSYGRIINAKLIALSGEDITEKRDLNENTFFINLGGTWFFNDRVGLHCHWSKSLNDIDHSKGAILYSRSINAKLYYFF